jgi:hypothetical protein
MRICGILASAEQLSIAQEVSILKGFTEHQRTNANKAMAEGVSGAGDGYSLFLGWSNLDIQTVRVGASYKF